MNLEASAAQLQKELDTVLNMRLNLQFTDRETAGGRRMSSVDNARKSLATPIMDISAFARFLTDQRCLEVLLFWKEVEQFKTMFDRDEKAALFMKIYNLYCVPGAERQVNFRGQYFADIDAQKTAGERGDVDDEVFDTAQNEVYELMRLDLFPRFKETFSRIADIAESAEERATSVSEVTAGTNPAATRSFMRFAKVQMCEEALLFWMEANDYSLLFQPSDRETNAKSIYDTYMGPKAKTQVNVGDHIVKAVAVHIENKKFESDLFLPAQKEIVLFLEQDLFPRYEEWMSSGEGVVKAAPGKASSDASLLDQSRLGDRDKMREAMVELLDSPSDVAAIREIARTREAEENLDFYLEAKKYTLLFADKDRQETAARLWDKYLALNADRRVNVPDHIYNKLKKAILDEKTSDARVFDAAIKDILMLFTDNIYPAYIKSKEEKPPAEAPVAKKPPPASGGCCALM